MITVLTKHWKFALPGAIVLCALLAGTVKVCRTSNSRDLRPQFKAPVNTVLYSHTMAKALGEQDDLIGAQKATLRYLGYYDAIDDDPAVELIKRLVDKGHSVTGVSHHPQLRKLIREQLALPINDSEE